MQPSGKSTHYLALRVRIPLILIHSYGNDRANEMLVSIPAPGRAASTSSSSFRPRPSDAHNRPDEDFRTSTPLPSGRGPGSRSMKDQLQMGGMSTPNSASSSLPRFPVPRVHRRTKPRVSLGDFHDMPPDLIDVEHDYSESARSGRRESIKASSPFTPFALEEDEDEEDNEHDLDLDLELDLGVDENMLDPSSILSLHPKFKSKPKSKSKSTSKSLRRPVELESQVEASESDAFSLARCYFDTKELERCKRVLQGCRSKKAMFLRLYAVYLVCPNGMRVRELRAQAKCIFSAYRRRIRRRRR